MNEHDEIVLGKNKKLSQYTLRKEKAENNFRAFIKRQLKSGKGAIFLAEADGTAAGYTSFSLKMRFLSSS